MRAALSLAAALAAAALLAGCGGGAHRAPAELQQLVDIGLPVYCGGGRGHDVALTFDDGPGPASADVIALLKKAHAHATFFLIGRSAVRKPGLVRREVAVGTVGDHTWSHPDLTRLGDSQLERQVQRARLAISVRAGRPVRLFRPSFGAHGGAIDETAQVLGLVEVLWSVDSGDASAISTPSPKAIYERVARHIQPGSIVLMHENITGEPDVAALELLLPELRRRHLETVSVERLLADDPPSRGQVENGIAGCSVPQAR
jgi:peptidoglycan/xylan/chitin deacetylase (PgdA/CDA1 family)